MSNAQSMRNGKAERQDRAYKAYSRMATRDCIHQFALEQIAKYTIDQTARRLAIAALEMARHCKDEGYRVEPDLLLYEQHQGQAPW